MNKKTYYISSSILFMIVAIAHAVRAIAGWELIIEGTTIPLWMSWVAVVLTGYLAIRGFSYAKKL